MPGYGRGVDEKWACEAKVPLPERGHQKEYATTYVHRNLAEKLMELMVKNRGQVVAFRFESRAWLPSELGFGHGFDDFWIYRGTIERLTVLNYSGGPVYNVEMDFRSEPINIPQTVQTPPAPPAPLTTKAMLKELWRRYRKYMDSLEPCSYTRPQSDYPNPEIFFL